MRYSARVMSLALALAMTGAMGPQAFAKTPSQMQGHKMTHKASRRTRAYSGRHSKNTTPTVKPGVRRGSM
jgi:hypothetical protein